MRHGVPQLVCVFAPCTRDPDTCMWRTLLWCPAVACVCPHELFHPFGCCARAPQLARSCAAFCGVCAVAV